MREVPDSFEIRGQTFSGLHGLPPEQAESLHRLTVRHGTACGCGPAAAAVSSAVPLYLLGLPAAQAIGAAVAGAVVAKCSALWLARRRFAATTRRLDAALDSVAWR
jgi:hypothetical protein